MARNATEFITAEGLVASPSRINTEEYCLIILWRNQNTGGKYNVPSTQTSQFHGGAE